MKLAECRGDWALVTGASSGIGRAFAVQLAAVGVNLALVARREPLLRALAEEIEQRHAVRALAMPIDLGKPDAATAIKARLASNGIKIRLLVNNAAFGHWGRFENGTQTAYQDMIQVNVSAMVALCQAFLPDLSGFSSSAIINVSSPAAFQPVPYMAVYAASKAFVSSFSQALYGEWADRGVLVQVLVPGPTATEFDTIAGAYASALQQRGSPAEVVRDSLAHLEEGSPVALSAKGTYKQRFFAGLFPAKMVIREVGKMFRPPQDKI